MLIAQSKHETQTVVRQYDVVPIVFLLATGIAWLLMGVVLPLHGLLFPSAQLIFTGQPLLDPHLPSPTQPESWGAIAIFAIACTLLFVWYVFALKYLLQRIGLRYILLSALVFGAICLVFPVVTSPDLFSYIAYARMQVVYSLNPLVTTPDAIRSDVIYPLLYWKQQPSAYGPTWIMLTALLQWGANVTGKNITVMVILLRLLGLAAHLLSIVLIWSISGHLQRAMGKESKQTRILATLAFAWNPLLLFEAVVNAHNDTVMLLLVLLGLWFLVRQNSLFSYACVACMLALATCLKVNAALLVPGLLVYLWWQPRHWQKLAVTLCMYLAIVLALYAPFWDSGAILHLLDVNPGTYRNINTLPEFFGRLYNAIAYLFGAPLAPDVGSQAEHIAHTVSILCFALAYVFLCWQALFSRHRLSSLPQLIRWMAITWFVYCLLGAPWFWPWYAVTFFGLFALTQVSMSTERQMSLSIIMGIFAFSLLSVYGFFPWGIYNSFVPFLEGFRWAYVRGGWVWVPVLILLLWIFKRKRSIKVSDNYA